MASKNRRVEQHNPMSIREKQVLCLLARAYGPDDIAVQLQLTRNYVYANVRLLKARFDADTVVGIVKRAIEEGIIDANGNLCEESARENPAH